MARLREEQAKAVAELEQIRTALEAAHEQRAGELAELAAQRDGLQQELGAALDRLGTVGAAAEEADRLREEVERLEKDLGEIQESGEQELTRLREEQAQTLSELDQVRAALGEAHEHRAGELADLAAQRDGLQQELGAALERLGELGPAAEERDRLRAELEQIRADLAEVQESCAVEVRRVVEERDSLTAELTEAREMLEQAERVRESQIALGAERDRAVAEVERLQAVATEAEAAAEEANRLLLEEQDSRRSEVETVLARQRLLEQELGDALDRLARANAAAADREQKLQVGSERLIEALNAVRALAAELVPGTDLSVPEDEDEAETENASTEPEAEAEAETEAASESEPESEPKSEGYSLFVPGPNGYELIPQTGVPPQAGQIVELVLPDSDEVTVYEVARSSRTLPEGDVCVYLSQR
jgi:chromosome segregation ATPase